MTHNSTNKLLVTGQFTSKTTDIKT